MNKKLEVYTVKLVATFYVDIPKVGQSEDEVLIEAERQLSDVISECEDLSMKIYECKEIIEETIE